MRYLDGREAATRECEWCHALAGEGCRILQGNRASRVETFADGSPCGVHIVRRLVWEAEDMTRPCDYCGAQVEQPCRTVGKGYYSTTALRPHYARLADSPLAYARQSKVIHARDSVHALRALCGVAVSTNSFSPSGALTRRPTCRTCRLLVEHARASANLSPPAARVSTH